MVTAGENTEMHQVFNQLKTVTNEVIELNKKLFELCSRLNDIIEK